MRLYIPEIGDVMQLDQEWTFTLQGEYRNERFGKKMGVSITEWKYHGDFETADVTLPAGSLLKVDRIYIRKGADRFSSITFYAYPASEAHRQKRKSLGRFWVKLQDVNQINFSPIHSQKV
tara:strand:- start:5709 stop:6068 length:360 start_codon:yes stop_codon:yes gene_type:complete